MLVMVISEDTYEVVMLSIANKNLHVYMCQEYNVSLYEVLTTS